VPTRSFEPRDGAMWTLASGLDRNPGDGNQLCFIATNRTSLERAEYRFRNQKRNLRIHRKEIIVLRNRRDSRAVLTRSRLNVAASVPVRSSELYRWALDPHWAATACKDVRSGKSAVEPFEKVASGPPGRAS
jgi:hypothetical protein